MIELCLERLSSRSKYNPIQARYCQLPKGHSGPHDEFPFLVHLEPAHPGVARKIVRDSIMTTGAAWKSKEAGPNRILRWVMLLDDAELLRFGINMQNLKPQVVAKLREKAAPYELCIQVAKKLTWLAYRMPEAPEAPPAIKDYLEAHFGQMEPSSTGCMVCLMPLPFTLFERAARGKAEIETGHSSPREHNPDNVGFAHRECNIAQGSKTLDEFYEWISAILARVRAPKDRQIS